jgi:hypothetical protein
VNSVRSSVTERTSRSASMREEFTGRSNANSQNCAGIQFDVVALGHQKRRQRLPDSDRRRNSAEPPTGRADDSATDAAQAGTLPRIAAAVRPPDIRRRLSLRHSWSRYFSSFAKSSIAVTHGGDLLRAV